MFIKSIIFMVLVQCSFGQMENHEWDLAVVIDDQIDLLLSNGTQIGSTYEQFSKLKALTFDNIRHQFVVSDMDQQNDTIFSVALTKKTDITPIIENLPDDVQGLAIDPITDTLYWTDSINKTINYVSLNTSDYNPKILFSFEEEHPQDITIDICRRYIYWTNSNVNRPTIERSRIGSGLREIIVDSGLYQPAGIAIDYHSKRLIWADMKEGIYYSIESSNFEGKERELIYHGTHTKPFGVAVDMNAIYWTDINNNALWHYSKFDKNAVPVRIRDFKEKPMGIVAKNVEIRSLPDCTSLEKAIEKFNQNITEYFRTKEQAEEFDTEDEVPMCLHGGELVDGHCRCPRGFVGDYCEVSLCHNYCLRGKCGVSSLGYPQCRCPQGYSGSRCDKNACDGHCLNEGVCHFNGMQTQCKCLDGFSGRRCEIKADFCEMYCKDKQSGLLREESNENLCRCDDNEKYNLTSTMPLMAKSDDHPAFFAHFQDPEFLIMTTLMTLSILLTVVLSIYICSSRRRPRIKKRIIVNKNVTPLTYRPQPTTEQCEITIENCCNMNICETPCFEPPQLACRQNKNDDKKKLLSNMENGEDLY